MDAIDAQAVSLVANLRRTSADLEHVLRGAVELLAASDLAPLFEDGADKLAAIVAAFDREENTL